MNLLVSNREGAVNILLSLLPARVSCLSCSNNLKSFKFS